MMLQPGFHPEPGRPGWSVSIMLYYGRRPLLPLFSPANWSARHTKGASKISRTDNTASKITSFTSPSLLIGLPLSPVQNTQNPSSPENFPVKPIETGEIRIGKSCENSPVEF